MDTSNLIPQIRELMIVHGINILVALAIFIIGRWVAKLDQKIYRKNDGKKGCCPRGQLLCR